MRAGFQPFVRGGFLRERLTVHINSTTLVYDGSHRPCRRGPSSRHDKDSASPHRSHQPLWGGLSTVNMEMSDIMSALPSPRPIQHANKQDGQALTDEHLKTVSRLPVIRISSPPLPHITMSPPAVPLNSSSANKANGRQSISYADLMKPDEDWRTLQDASERRKIQNRLAQRAYRTFFVAFLTRVLLTPLREKHA